MTRKLTKKVGIDLFSLYTKYSILTILIERGGQRHYAAALAYQRGVMVIILLFANMYAYIGSFLIQHLQQFSQLSARLIFILMYISQLRTESSNSAITDLPITVGIRRIAAVSRISLINIQENVNLLFRARNNFVCCGTCFTREIAQFYNRSTLSRKMRKRGRRKRTRKPRSIRRQNRIDDKSSGPEN